MMPIWWSYTRSLFCYAANDDDAVDDDFDDEIVKNNQAIANNNKYILVLFIWMSLNYVWLKEAMM